MGEGRVVVFYSQLWAKVPKRVVVKLLLIIWDQDDRDPVSTDDVPPNKTSHILLCDGDQCFNFDSFGEVVYVGY